MQQVVLNLILNAVEAMGSVEAGARELLISTEQNQANGVLVAVRDSGPGIDPKHLERVFEAFYTTKSSGVGMGLSICRSIIDAHGGRLWAEANEPRGAVFQFTLPSAERELMNPVELVGRKSRPKMAFQLISTGFVPTGLFVPFSLKLSQPCPITAMLNSTTKTRCGLKIEVLVQLG